MNADGLAPDVVSRDPLDSPAPAGVHAWRRDVIEGVARRFAIAAVPALLMALVVRALRGDWFLSAFAVVTLAACAVPLSSRLPPRTRIGFIVGTCVWTNAVLMVYARGIPFHGVLMPVAAGFAALMGGARWAWWTLAATSATWMVPWLLAMSGLPSPVDIPWPSQYVRLWLFHTTFTAGLVATITHVARHLEASLAQRDRLLERVRLESRAVQALAGRVREAEEQERSRLAHDLHDDFGQRLTALRMKLQLSRREAGPQPAAIDDCVAMSEELLRDVRTFARGLRPPLLEEVGLGPALRALVEGHADREGFTVTADVPDALPRLPVSQELAAYRVVQEALANAVRHASASGVTLAVRHEGSALVVSLTDDGRGFDPDRAVGATPGEHLGLVGMRERAAFIGAALEVRSAPGRGTSVRLRIPCAPAAAGRKPAVAS